MPARSRRARKIVHNLAQIWRAFVSSSVNPLHRDEAFGPLEVRVWAERRQGQRVIHDETGLTTVFVTHDQKEAMELADLVVMSMGRGEQIGRSQAI